MNIQFRDLINNAPLSPGIYKMYDDQMNLLYIGKAKNLFNRLQQYIDVHKLENHKKVMRSLVTYVEWETTATEQDALVLEQQLIKTLKPKYNVMLTDGKMYPMLALTKHNFPRLLKFRGKISQKKDVFGPYPSVYELHDTIKTIQYVCKLRTCTDVFMKNRTKPCLLYQIGRCSAPCCLTQNNYDKNVQLARRILSGYSEPIINGLTKAMTDFADKNDFENAAIIRNKISALTKTSNRGIRQNHSYTQIFNWDKNVSSFEKLIGHKIKCAGVFDNSHLFGKQPVGAMIAFGHNGFIKSFYRHFKLQDIRRAGNDIAMMEEFINRAIKEIPQLDLIIVDGGIAQWDIANKVSKGRIPVFGITKGEVRNGDEHFIMPDRTTNRNIQKDSTLFMMLRSVRDEAHKFVITYHRTVRAKQLTSSILDSIEGIGSKRKKLLLLHFGSIRMIIDADLQSLLKVPGLGKRVAEKIYAYFHSEMV